MLTKVDGVWSSPCASHDSDLEFQGVGILLGCGKSSYWLSILGKEASFMQNGIRDLVAEDRNT